MKTIKKMMKKMGEWIKGFIALLIFIAIAIPTISMFGAYMLFFLAYIGIILIYVLIIACYAGIIYGIKKMVKKVLQINHKTKRYYNT